MATVHLHNSRIIHVFKLISSNW